MIREVPYTGMVWAQARLRPETDRHLLVFIREWILGRGSQTAHENDDAVQLVGIGYQRQYVIDAFGVEFLQGKLHSGTSHKDLVKSGIGSTEVTLFNNIPIQHGNAHRQL